MAEKIGLGDPRLDQMRTRVTSDGDGGVKTERISLVPSLTMVDLAGNICQVSMTNGIWNRATDDPYGQRIRQIKESKGMVAYGACPQFSGTAREWLPQVLQGRPPCHQSADGYPISAKHPCKCVLELIEIRRERHAVKMAKVNAREVTPEMIQAKASAKALETLPDAIGDAIGKAVGAAVEKLAAPAAKEKPSK